MKTLKIVFLIISVSILLILLTACSSNESEPENSMNIENNTQNIVNNTTVNPYEKTAIYNGLYKFSLISDNGSGYTFESAGIISINNDICRIKLHCYTQNYDFEREYEGFCGINSTDEGSFYISFSTGNDNTTIYKCEKQENNFICKLESKYDIVGCYSDNLQLTKIESTDFNKSYSDCIAEWNTQKELQEKAEFIESCNEYTYEQIARNPDNFKGTNVKITGEVIQVMEDSTSTNLRVNITNSGNYYTDTIYVVYHPEIGEDKILENDIITIYGTSQGDCSYTTVLGATVTLPNILAKYIIIN